MVGERVGLGRLWGRDRDKGCCQNTRISPVGRQLETMGGEDMADNDMSAEERDILGKFERGELRASAGAEQEMKAAREAARNTFNKSKRVNLRMTERDFNLAHSRAREEGVPYQTLLSSVIHKYLSGRLTEKG